MLAAFLDLFDQNNICQNLPECCVPQVWNLALKGRVQTKPLIFSKPFISFKHTDLCNGISKLSATSRHARKLKLGTDTH